MTRITVVTVALLATSAIWAAGCRPEPADTRSSSAPSPVPTSVGPAPGPGGGPGGAGNPFGLDRAAGGEGRHLFVEFNCSGCHGEHGGGGMGPSLRDVDWLYGNSEPQLFDSIAQGRAHGMPAWGRMLSPDQIWRLVTYVKSLRTSSEPNPPASS